MDIEHHVYSSFFKDEIQYEIMSKIQPELCGCD